MSDGERKVQVRALHEDDERLLLEIDGVGHEFHVELRPDAVHVVHEGALLEFREPLGRADRPQAISDGALLAPMPGSVLRVSAGAGETVTQGQVLLILEAMKMELALTAPFDGTVEEITVGEGDQVTARQLLRARDGGSARMADHVTVYEVGPRDGLQNESATVAPRPRSA